MAKVSDSAPEKIAYQTKVPLRPIEKPVSAFGKAPGSVVERKEEKVAAPVSADAPVSAPEKTPLAETAVPVPQPPKKPFVPAIPMEQQKLELADLQQRLQPEEAPWRIAGEVLNTYIVCEDGENAVWLIDKHAAHERMNFDRLMAEQTPPMRQTLLKPVAAELGREDAAVLLENLSLLERMGFACEDFGDGAVLVREVPADMDGEDTVSALEEMAQTLRSGRSTEEKRQALLHTVACKAAIKGGWKSDVSELRVLVEKVQRGEVKYCPHGRPVAVKLTKYELEKMFKRA